MINIDIQKILDGGRQQIDLSVKATIEKGAFITLTGPSGAGKTTILRMMSGLTAPDQGIIKVGNNIWYDSKNKVNLSPQDRSTALVFQDLALFPNMSVTENIAYAMQPQDQRELTALVSLMELGNLRNTNPARLSRGQQQRVAIARAIAQRPSLLLLDEPFSALDKVLSEKLLASIMALHKKYELTIILVSHDPSFSAQITDQYWLMDGDGSITISDNYSDPNTITIEEIRKIDGKWNIVIKDQASIDQLRPGDHLKL